MKPTLAASLALLTVGLVACDHLPKPGTRDYLSVATQEYPNSRLRTVGTLFVWSNDVNAGVIFEDGDVCMQRAMTMRSMSARGETSIPASIVSAASALEAAAADDNEQAAIALSGAISQAAAALSTTTERTAFLDIGMFYLCQLHANDAITGAESAALTAQLIRDAALIVPVAGYLPTSNAPDLSNVERMQAPEARTDPGAGRQSNETEAETRTDPGAGGTETSTESGETTETDEP